ncbi:hypothetical protein DACRYDRAFT_118868 [Dacryopinax primogenitus]|uniref:Ribosome biogenesis protein SLX9 n=1 Tax=Dacryopinax primogenitus (strain DJM 731) TaxID=1858805 RepID=M5FR66_DACPD|nr:uncharacterized protein DACRYDRAFT_118868 [Dacryopinax primogenitus]EJT98108.1 hypothetical protein DACRYDRAFT_118868 [Dacryopinax primogenitus]
MTPHICSSFIMPKAQRRARTVAHDPPLRPKKTLPSLRDFAVNERVEKVVSGSKADQTGDAILAENAVEPVQTPKKERVAARHERLLNRLNILSNNSPHAPYAFSKSALKRYKRKAKEDIPLSGLGAALAEVGEEVQQEQEQRAEQKAKEGKIGEGKERGLSSKQRRKAVETEAKHLNAVLKDPTFRANAFAAIRQHTANTLEKRDT